MLNVKCKDLKKNKNNIAFNNLEMKKMLLRTVFIDIMKFRVEILGFLKVKDGINALLNVKKIYFKMKMFVNILLLNLDLWIQVY